ncbi:MAG TPA: glycosyltransferase [Rhizobium sp.]|nr:glycosyltransferase [Rhizobium sp.]
MSAPVSQDGQLLPELAGPMYTGMTDEAVIQRADALRNQGRWLAAALGYAAAIARNPDLPHLWLQYGHLNKEGHFFRAAEFGYRVAIRLDGSDPDPRLHLAHLLRRVGRLRDALKEFELLHELPNAPNVSWEIKRIEVALAQPDYREVGDLPLPMDALLPAAEEALAGLTELSQRFFDLEAKSWRDEHCDRRRFLKRTLASVRELYRQAFRTEIARTLTPRARLIIEGGDYLATESRPQFAIVSPCLPLDPGWYEITLAFTRSSVPPFPVLYADHGRRWQDFTANYLEVNGGTVRTLVFFPKPVFDLRLEPVDRKGRFLISAFSITRQTMSDALRQAKAKHPEQMASLQTQGLAGDKQQLSERFAEILRYSGPDAYQRWIANHGSKPEVAQLARPQSGDVKEKPRFAFVADAADGADTDWDATLETLTAQTNVNWSFEICLGGQVSADRRKRLDAAERLDARVRCHERDFMGLVAVVCADRGTDLLIFLRPGTRLMPRALERFADAIRANPGAAIVYADEDAMDERGRRHTPLFKPDWDPDYFASYRYLGDFVALASTFSRQSLNEVRNQRSDLMFFELLVLVASDVDAVSVLHITDILSHRKNEVHDERESTTMLAFSPEELAIVERQVRSIHPETQVRHGTAGAARTIWPILTPEPLVSLIIPTRDRVDVLRECIDSILAMTDYPRFEILVVDNDSCEAETLEYLASICDGRKIHWLQVPGEFNFSLLNNRAAERASGDVLGLVNNDIVAIEPGWLREMVSHAVRPDVGAVGAKLLYRSGHIQHAGIVCGIGEVAAHPHKFYHDGDYGYMGRLSCVQTFSAVTGACLVVERSKYQAASGLDESNLKVAFNDVDFCLKLDALGYRNVFTPYARLLHLEGVSRGFDTSPEKAARYAQEAEFMGRKWADRMTCDPYYNPNLTHEREDFSLGE